MQLIIGGYAQGKLNYVLQRYTDESCLVYDAEFPKKEENGNGEKSVFFSTHNISDMENVTDYAIIMENGQIVEQGFVEDLKEKYIVIKGDAADTQKAKDILYTITTNPYGFEGICLSENLDKLAGLNVTKEIPTLYQISVAVMKNNTKIVMR